MKTMHLGPEEILVAAKIGVTRGDTAAEVAETINRAEVNIREAEPMVTSLYLEPDIYDADYVPAPRPERPGAPATDSSNSSACPRQLGAKVCASRQPRQLSSQTGVACFAGGFLA